jgi:hypothetical protein
MKLELVARYLGAKQSAQLVDDIINGTSMDNVVELSFIGCVFVDLFDVLHHYQNVDKRLQHMRFRLEIRECKFVRIPTNMIANVETIYMYGNCEFYDDFIQMLLLKNNLSLQSFWVFAYTNIWSELMQLRNLRELLLNSDPACPNTCDKIMPTIIENNPWLTALVCPPFKWEQFYTRNINIDTWVTVGSVQNAQYHMDIKWVRFVLGMMRMAQEMNHAHSNSITSILELHLLPQLEKFRPSWWNDSLCIPLYQSFLG